MRSMAKVTIKLGGLEIPDVSMFNTIETGEKVSFNQLHAPCHQRVKQELYCPDCQRTIVDKASEIVKGYPVGESKWIVMSKQEIESCKRESTDVLTVIQFVDKEEIPPIFFSASYYLSPKKTGAFSLLVSLIQDTGKMALAKGVMREKDHFYALTSLDNILIAYDLYFPSEIRSAKDVPKPDGKAIEYDDETYELLGQLVEKMSKPFAPEKIKDEYTLALKNLIEAKASGKVVPIEEVVKEKKALSLKDALKESLGQAVNF